MLKVGEWFFKEKLENSSCPFVYQIRLLNILIGLIKSLKDSSGNLIENLKKIFEIEYFFKLFSKDDYFIKQGDK